MRLGSGSIRGAGVKYVVTINAYLRRRKKSEDFKFEDPVINIVPGPDKALGATVSTSRIHYRI